VAQDRESVERPVELLSANMTTTSKGERP
jgi:hypothetical protein